MKSYTITCHNVYNYGASLQAFALQKYLVSCGIHNMIIDYRPNYLDWHYKLSWWISPRSRHYKRLKKNPFLRLFYISNRFFHDIQSYQRKLSFDTFSNDNLLRTKIVRSIDDIVKETKDADLLLSGSDQVWNSISLDNGLDPVFYLNFGCDKAKRISYAASFGGESINESSRDQIKKMLSKLDSISVREQSGVNILKSLGLKGKCVCDPVLLLSKQQWEKAFEEIDFGEKYILIYNLSSCSEDIVKCASNLKKQTSYKLYSIYNQSHIPCDKEFMYADPALFVQLVRQAECIITNSFHASVFSIIFQKDFYCFTNNMENSARIIDLLALFKLMHRHNLSDTYCMEHIDYRTVTPLVVEYVKQSQNWINSQIVKYD